MDYLTLFLYVIMVTGTPGPNNLMALYVCAEHGVWKGRKFLIGAGTGFTTVFVLCGVLSYWLAALIPIVEPYIKWLGVLYLLYLAFCILKSKNDSGEDKTSINTFIYGFSMQFINVKVWLFGLTVYSMYVTKYFSSLPVIALFGLSFGIIGIATMMLWAFGGTLIKNIFAKYRIAFNLTMAGFLVYCAYKVVF